MAKALYKNLPESPGVYLMKGVRGKTLYIGKAGNLRRRVSSYFLRANDSKIEKLLSEIRKIDYQRTDTAIEALILESQLIKKHEPTYNAKEKDDKSFLYVVITKENFPRVLLVRGKEMTKWGLPREARRAEPHSAKATRGKWGPFTSATSIREALRIIRKIFPYSIHPPKRQETRDKRQGGRGCFDYELGLCPGTCIGAVSRTEYLKSIRSIKLFLGGKKKLLLAKLEKEMGEASKKLEFEKAERLRRQIFALKHIRDVALIADERLETSNKRQATRRIEGYDISNISGTSAVGSMVVFSARGGPASGWESAEPDKSQYRKFRISTITSSDDIGMIKEMLRRRFNNPWPYPALILIDGGKGQVNAVKSVLDEFGLDLPVAGIAKGPSRKKNDFFGYRPSKEEEGVLVKVRDEAHRFALSYHRKVRGAKFISV